MLRNGCCSGCSGRSIPRLSAVSSDRKSLRYDNYGHIRANRAPTGYKRITLHFVYAVKHDGRYKARVVAGGHLTDAPIESVYSGVVSLRGVRTVVFLAELNDLELWQSDVGNAYLEAETDEKVAF